MSASCNRVSSVGELWPRVDEYDYDYARVCVTVESNSDAERAVNFASGARARRFAVVFQQQHRSLVHLVGHTQRRNSFIRGPLVRFGRGPYLYIFIKSHMLINREVNIVLLS